MEAIVDFLVYFLFWLVVVVYINKFWKPIKISRILTIILAGLTGISLAGSFLIAGNPDNIFYLKRNFKMEVLETGYKCIWQDRPQPACYEISGQHAK